MGVGARVCVFAVCWAWVCRVQHGLGVSRRDCYPRGGVCRVQHGLGGELAGLLPPVVRGAVGSLQVGGACVGVGARVCGLCLVFGWGVPCGARAGG